MTAKPHFAGLSSYLDWAWRDAERRKAAITTCTTWIYTPIYRHEPHENTIVGYGSVRFR